MSKVARKESLDANTLRESLTTIPINVAEKDKDATDLWVLNITDSWKSTRGTMSRHLVPIKHADGDTVVRIEDTWLPQNLSDQLPRGILLRSSEFRKAVSGNAAEAIRPAIRIISDEDAQRLLEHPEAEAEKKNIRLNAAEKQQARDRAGKNEEAKTEKPPEARPVIMAMVTRYANGLLDDNDLMIAIKAEKSRMTRDDLRFLMEDGPTSKVKRYAARKLGLQE